MIKKKNNPLSNMGVEEAYRNIIEATSNKPTANILLIREKLKAFSVRPGIRQGYPLLPLIPQVMEVHGHGNQTRNINKRHPNWKGRNRIVVICRQHGTI